MLHRMHAVEQRVHRRTLAAPAFVGRAAELAALQRALLWAGQWRGDFVLVEAQSGGGKTRLLEELGIRSSAQGAWVLRGRGDEQVAQRPLHVLEGVVRQVALAAESNPLLAGGLRERLGDERAAVCDALPQLGSILGPRPPRRLGPEAHGEERTLRALAALLHALGEPTRPVVLLLDDCQWLDDLTLKLLSRWQAGQNPNEERGPGSHVLIVLAFRKEEVPREHPLRSLSPLLQLELLPLAPAELRALLESMAGKLPDSTADELARLSKGNPFAAIALLQGLVEDPSAAGGALHLGEGAAELVRARLARLPQHAARLLSAGAVLGREFDVGFASALVDQTPLEAQQALDEARARLMVLAEPNSSRVGFAHSKLREAVLSRLSPDERRALHRRAAAEMEARDPGRDFEIAYHFDQAGDHAQALPAALRAAESARSHHALAVAERNYRIAERGCALLPPDDERVRRQVAEGLGDVLMLRGHYDEAAQKLAWALTLARGAEDRAALEGKIGELAFRRGDLSTATESLERALRGLGQVVPRSRLATTVLFCWESLVQILHAAMPALLIARRSQGERSARDLLAARLFGRLSYAYYYTRFPLAPLWAHLRELNVAERYQPTPELAAAYAKHALVLLWVPLLARGRAYAERALKLYQSLGDTWGEGHTCFLAGAGLANVSQYQQAMQLLREGRGLLERTGDRWEENATGANMGICHFWLGELREAAVEAERSVRVAREIGDTHAIGVAAKIWALATGGRIPEGLCEETMRVAGADAFTHCGLLVAEGTRLLRARKLDEALRALETADGTLTAAGVKVDFVATVPAQLTTALRVRAEAEGDPALKAGLLAKAAAVSARAVKLGRRFPNHLAHALREAGLLAAYAGRSRKARSLLDEAVRAADRLDQRYELAQAQLARSIAGKLLGWRSADDDETKARAALTAVGSDFALGTPLA